MSANLADLVRAAAAERGEHVALVVGGRSVTWHQVDVAVDEAAAGLQALGLVPGDRVALVLGNVPEFVYAYFGALRAGLVAVPANVGSTSVELGWLIADSGSRAVVYDRSGAPVVRELHDPDGGQLHRIVVGAPAPGEVAFGSFAGMPREHETDPEDLALLIYTSGTSGRPKGAMLSHRALLAGIEQVHSMPNPPVTADDVVLIVLPLFHIYALNGTLGAVVRCAATAVLLDRFDPLGTLDVVRQQGVTNIPGAPPMFVAWSETPGLAEAFAGVRLLLTGAAPMPPSVLDQIRTATGLPVFEGYGLTEASPGVTSTLMGGTAKPGSVGRALPGVELRLVDEDGAPAEEGDTGEIQVRGPNLFSGYWPDGEGGPDTDGWYATGDVAYEDDDGDLVLVDRRKELVIVSGFNVYPREVEDAIAAHPDVQEVAVVGVPHPYTGEAVKAYVVARPGRHVAPSDITAHVGSRLARFKWPTIIELVDALPHSATGKVAKGRLRERTS